MSPLRQTFFNLLQSYNSDEQQIETLWNEIETAYSEKSRHYHTLSHLEHLLYQLEQVKTEILDWNAVLFTLYYHDFIYSAIRKDNEAKSAAVAEKRMLGLSVPNAVIDKTVKQILATQKHLLSEDPDTNLFTDADLSVLGLDWESYTAYFKNVRKEYSIYPDLLYIPGRKKVLKHFLEMERIYKTAYFFSTFEAQARKNIRQEFSLL